MAGHTVTREHTVLNYLGLTTISAHAHSWIHRNEKKTYDKQEVDGKFKGQIFS
ncbi:hypothetical protein MU249_000769 [Salmonella enterica]|uniref:Uncharacterized protein n=1 Tax=Salmonella enterica TaxID=28901 RepID=A0A765FWY4_SALER|nr:hypothetical protein [Salmonella enterica]EEE5611157.1 hypothetical protein [Salmonella enterica subsp. enterica serovar Typhimurium]EEM3070642.1 hypothetical protein [Salmonella enterica subsp. enterica serovar Java]EHE7039663.1 hypothetical protein [Salmonella enterica subsp. enterica serovar Newport]EHE8610764.1 hypothetical protein [Salmonella enterica subsp. enterica serovar 4,[5],12:b:-]EHJ5405411.1 hypothetical protein [Salmonella enterica subsp. enterica serovar Wedding]MCH5495031.